MNNNGIIHWAEIEPLCVIRLITRKLWLVVMAALIGVMSASIYMTSIAKSTYTSQVTFAVAARSGGQIAYYQNINTAAEVAAIYSQLFESDIMQQTMHETLGDYEFGTVKASKIGDTNLIKVTAIADSPRESLMTLQSVIDNYDKLSEYVSSNAVLTVMNTPTVQESTGAYKEPTKLYILGALGGALCMMALLFLMSAASGTVQNSTGAKNRIDAKVLTSIPHEGGTGLGKKQLERSELNILSPLVSFGFTEAIHRISAKLEQEMMNSKKVFIFSSVTEGEGKSTVAVNTALALANTGSKTLFIDLDIRRPVQSQMLGINVREGREFGELLMNGANPEKILSSAITERKTGMDVLLSSKCYTELMDTLPFALLRKIINLARERYDCIVIDTPPISYFSDTEQYADLSDATVLVVRQDLVPAAEINTCIDSLRACRAEFIGCVLNDMMSLNENDAGGYGHYGKYGKYGKYDKYAKYANSGRNDKESKSGSDTRGHK